MQKNNMSFLKNLTTVADARTARASSWDQSGRNKDYWLVNAGDTAVMADVEGPGCINHIWVTTFCREILGPSIQHPVLSGSVAPVTEMENAEGVNWEINDPDYYRKVLIRMTWDDFDGPSVLAPLGDFFCCGFARDCVVNSLPIVVVPARGMNCYFQMPFGKRARITLENQHETELDCFFYQIDYREMDEMPQDLLYFHAQWRRERLTELQKDYTVLDGVKGKGHYVGTYIAHTSLERYWYGEGEMKFYIDGDDEYPTICGTGMEDYFGGSWSFAKQINGKTVEQTYNTPFLGYPYYSRHDESVHSDYYNDDTMPQRGFYRWHIMDPILFEEDLRVTLQQIGSCHKGNFERQDDVASVAYWYQTLPHQPFAPLAKKEERWPR